MPKEQEEFLKDLEVEKPDVFNAPLIPEEGDKEEKKEETEPTEKEKFNRRERRLMQKLQDEREANIAQAARLAALTEARELSKNDKPTSYEEKVARIYGNATPENAAATELLQAALKEAKEAAKQEAIEAMRAEREAEAESIRTEEKTLDGMVEELEDTYGVTLNEQAQKGFFALLERLSPKDRDGNVIAYADPHAVFEEYQARTKKPEVNRAKEIASRGMNRTGSSASTTVEQTAAERWLMDNGII